MTYKLSTLPPEIISEITFLADENDVTTLVNCGDTILSSKLKSGTRHLRVEVAIYGILHSRTIEYFDRLTHLYISNPNPKHASVAFETYFYHNLIHSFKLKSLKVLHLIFNCSFSWIFSFGGKLVCKQVMPCLEDLRIEDDSTPSWTNNGYDECVLSLPESITSLCFINPSFIDIKIPNLSHLTNLRILEWETCTVSNEVVSNLPSSLEYLTVGDVPYDIFDFLPPTVTSVSIERLGLTSSRRGNIFEIHLPKSLRALNVYSAYYGDSFVVREALPPEMIELGVFQKKYEGCLYICKSATLSKTMQKFAGHWFDDKSFYSLATQLQSLRCSSISTIKIAESVPCTLTELILTGTTMHHSVLTTLVRNLPHLTRLISPASCWVPYDDIYDALKNSTRLVHLDIEITYNDGDRHTTHLSLPQIISDNLQTLSLSLLSNDANTYSDSMPLAVPRHLTSLQLQADTFDINVELPISLTNLAIGSNVLFSDQNIHKLVNLVSLKISAPYHYVDVENLPESRVSRLLPDAHSHIESIMKYGFPPRLKHLHVLSESMHENDFSPPLSLKSFLLALPRGLRTLLVSSEDRSKAFFSGHDKDIGEFLNYIPHSLHTVKINIVKFVDESGVKIVNQGQMLHRRFCKHENCIGLLPKSVKSPHPSLVTFEVNDFWLPK